MYQSMYMEGMRFGPLTLQGKQLTWCVYMALHTPVHTMGRDALHSVLCNMVAD
jgi:hypothetical protein